MARLDAADYADAVSTRKAAAYLGRRALNFLAKFGSIIVFLLAWEIFASSGILTPFLLPKFSTVIARIASDMATGDWFINFGQTVYRAVFGYSCAAVIGVTIGILMGRTRLFRWFFDPVVSIGFPSPKVAFLPVFILWFDLFDTAKIVMVAFSSFFPIAAASWAGTFTVDKHFIWSARSLGASERQILTEIVLPAALPQILTGLQIALPIAMIVALVTEFLMGGQGLGGAMIESLRFGDSPGVFAGIVSIALAGITLIKTLEYIRKRLLTWHSESNGATA
jgi:ABC-type nitrate/sulfonate/bicarbonate transport system permease component